MWRNRTIANGPAEERVRDRSLLGDAVGSPSLDLNFAGGTLDPRITFTRSTVGTYYRGQFNQNLFTQSQDLTNAAYTPVGATMANITDTAPDGSTTVTRMTESALNERHVVGRSAYVPLAANLTHTLSVFVKKVSRRYIQLVGLSGASNSFSAIFDLDNGVITDTRAQGGNYISGSITAVGNGWYRCSITGNTTIAQTTLNVAHSNVATFSAGSLSAQTLQYLGDGTSQTLVWGYQLTEGSLLTPYIPTTTAAITQGQIASSQPWNLLLRSQEFDQSPWGYSQVTVPSTNNTAPDGTATAEEIMEAVATNANYRLFQSSLSVSNGTSYTFTVHAKAGSATVLQMTGNSTQFGLDEWANFNLANGTVGSVGSNVTGSDATITDVGNGWYRCKLTMLATASGTGSSVFVIFTNNNASASRDPSYSVTTGNQRSLYLWGAQLNEGTSALDYNPTTTVVNWLPRFENDPVTGEARGLLVEGGATNLLPQSADLATTWTNLNSTDSTNLITAPDGTVSADSFTDTATTAIHGMQQLIGGQSTSATYTFSCFVKKGSVRYLALGVWGSATDGWGVSVDLDTGGFVTTSNGAGYSVSGATITNVGNGWYRVSVSGITGTNNHYPTINHRTTQWSSGSLLESYAGSTANFTYVWGFQYEQQAFASSYIPTTTASVARGGDLAFMTGTNFSSWYNQSEGTFLADHDASGSGASPFGRWVGMVENTLNNYIDILRHLSSGMQWLVVDNGTTVVNSTSALTSATVRRVATAYRTNDFASSLNGGSPVTDTSLTIPTVSNLYIGCRAAGFQLNGTIRRIAYWPTRLPNATLQSLTT